MGVTVAGHASKKHTESASNTGILKHQKNCELVRGVACNFKEH